MTKAHKDSNLHINKWQSERKNLMKKAEHKMSTAIQSTFVQVKGLHTPLPFAPYTCINGLGPCCWLLLFPGNHCDNTVGSGCGGEKPLGSAAATDKPLGRLVLKEQRTKYTQTLANTSIWKRKEKYSQQKCCFEFNPGY